MAINLTIPQAIYTTADLSASGGSRGYQIVASTPTIDSRLKEELIAVSPLSGNIPFDVSFDHATQILPFPPAKPRYLLISRIFNRGLGFDGRPNAQYTHHLLFPLNQAAHIYAGLTKLDELFTFDLNTLGQIPTLQIKVSSADKLTPPAALPEVLQAVGGEDQFWNLMGAIIKGDPICVQGPDVLLDLDFLSSIAAFLPIHLLHTLSFRLGDFAPSSHHQLQVIHPQGSGGKIPVQKTVTAGGAGFTSASPEIAALINLMTQGLAQSSSLPSNYCELVTTQSTRFSDLIPLHAIYEDELRLTTEEQVEARAQLHLSLSSKWNQFDAHHGLEHILEAMQIADQAANYQLLRSIIEQATVIRPEMIQPTANFLSNTSVRLHQLNNWQNLRDLLIHCGDWGSFQQGRLEALNLVVSQFQLQPQFEMLPVLAIAYPDAILSLSGEGRFVLFRLAAECSQNREPTVFQAFIAMHLQDFELRVSQSELPSLPELAHLYIRLSQTEAGELIAVYLANMPLPTTRKELDQVFGQLDEIISMSSEPINLSLIHQSLSVRDGLADILLCNRLIAKSALEPVVGQKILADLLGHLQQMVVSADRNLLVNSLAASLMNPNWAPFAPPDQMEIYSQLPLLYFKADVDAADKVVFFEEYCKAGLPLSADQRKAVGKMVKTAHSSEQATLKKVLLETVGSRIGKDPLQADEWGKWQKILGG